MKKIGIVLLLLWFSWIVKPVSLKAAAFPENTFLIAEGTIADINNIRFWNFIESNNNAGIKLRIEEEELHITPSGSDNIFENFLNRLLDASLKDSSRIIPVFISFDGNIAQLDSQVISSPVASSVFFLPQGEAWPSIEYLIQANRRIIFFIEGNYKGESRIMHKLSNYALQLSARDMPATGNIMKGSKGINLELLMVNDFDELPTTIPPNRLSRNLVPDYINYLLEVWTRYGKRPNFIVVGEDIYNFDFIIEQLKSFAWIDGNVRVSDKSLEKVYWKNPDVYLTGGKFSFPYRGGEEIILSPFAPGYRMTPEHIVVTSEMDIPESYTIIATARQLSDELTGSFSFEDLIVNEASPSASYHGQNYSFSNDIERGIVLRLPENASVNLGSPENYGLRNSSFTVSCFVKFTEILEFGDNAIIGNYESGYRRGLHLILRSGNPYFGLWANDFISDVKLEPNTWYHLVWRYILETGEQSIYLNGKNIGSSDGHPPFSGTGDIHLGSALSQGASLRGYIDNLYIWDRPLGNEEINRLALDEQPVISHPDKKLLPVNSFALKMWGFGLLGIAGLGLLFFMIRKKKPAENIQLTALPHADAANQVLLYGEFKAVDRDGNDITGLFTPKVKELFLFILLHSVKNGTGVQVSDVDENLWAGLPKNKVSNNRAVTLNKLRKIICQMDGVEVITQNSFLFARLDEPFFCDYAASLQLVQLKGAKSKEQLEAFFRIVRRGRLLKDTDFDWLDEIRGFTGNLIIDNLLILASDYKKENKPNELDALAKRILEYDDLNEEALFLEIWSLQRSNNLHLARFNFDSFRHKYREILGEEYSMNFDEFNRHYAGIM